MSTNPFDEGQYQPYRYENATTTTATTTMMPPKHSQQPQHVASTTASSSPPPPSPIFSARGVEWPLPMAFNPTQYRKWRRESRALGSSLGIWSSGLRISIGSTSSGDNSGAGAGGGAKYMGGSAFATPSSENISAIGGGGGAIAAGGGPHSSSALGNVVVGGADVGRGGASLEGQSSTGGGGGGGYGGLTGLMGRVLGASTHPTSGMQGASFLNDIEEADLTASTTRIVLPPHAHCVAAANGCIIAAVECSPPPSTTSTSSSSPSHSGGFSSPNVMKQPQSKQSLAQLIPPLRMVSRWNVRRGSTMLGSDGNYLAPLPPPVRPNGIVDGDAKTKLSTPRGGGGSTSSNDPNFGRIEHTFVDPTGCHVLLSARNGEAYYLHSTSKNVVKLSGFGPSADGSYSGFRAGSSLSEVAVGGGDAAVAGVQMGVTPGSYVTAVGWDRDRGTEGSTKRILLGTSLGELYEYSLQSPLSSGKAKSSAFDTKAGELIAMMDEGDNDPIESPVLLHRLDTITNTGTNSGGEGRGTTVASRGPVGDAGAVGGILFQRVMGGIGVAGSGVGSGGCVVVLVSAGKLHRHTRLHTFRSEPSASSSLTVRSAFAHPSILATKGGGNSKSIVELPGSIDFADLCSCNDESFALRTETGIYHGTMERSGGVVALGGAGGVVGTGMLTYASLANHGTGVVMTTPASIALTPHHFITLSSNNIVRFINRVAKKIIQEERVDWVSVTQNSLAEIDLQYGGVPSRESSIAVAELITDIRRPDQIWLRRGRSLVHISSSNEHRDVWKYTLTRVLDGTGGKVAKTHVMTSSEEKQIESQFEHAKSLCTDPAQKAVVNAVRAEYHLLQGRVELAAKYMAQCPSSIMPFAEASTRLLLPMIGRDMNSENIAPHNNSRQANEALGASNLALIAFLSDKIKAAKSNHDSVVCTILGTWLAELHLQEREKWVNQEGKGQKTANHALLHQFLSTYVRDMDPRSIINVLASHDMNAGECAGYSAAAGDIGAAIDAALCGEDEKDGALDALRVLNDSSLEKAEPFYYKYALTLLSRAPLLAAKSFLARYTEGLSDTKLLPAFMHYEQRRTSNAGFLKAKSIDSSGSSPYPTLVNDPNASITYMEGVIKLGSKSPAIYNYLVSLYAGIEDEGPLFRFLSTHVPPASSSTIAIDTGSISDIMLKQAIDEKKTPLDKSYALRTILRTGRHFRSAVKLYMGYGMRQQAVELALKVDPSLARELARQSDDRDETKRLWLMIARNAAANGTSSRDGKEIVSRVVKVLKDCGPDILSIEDVLPFLPDFAQIDQLKDEICEALTSYSTKIENYLKEMNECDQTCDALRDELGRLKSTGTKIRADARCALTNKPILEQGQPFYVFPSGYAILETALKSEVMPYLNEKQRDRVAFIENELVRLRKSRASSGQNSCEIAVYDYEIEQLTVELGGLIAAECPLTGSIMVESIDREFSSDEDD